MKYLAVDFGSTYTKVTAINADAGEVVGTASAFTTIATDVMDGFTAALDALHTRLGGEFVYDTLLCCSSAGGGLKMVALGLVPELTAKAAKMAASSAGAKVVKTYAYEISQEEQDEIYTINPDVVLLCGGTDGGNKDVIIKNAGLLCEIKRDFSLIAAGNKTASRELEAILRASGKDYVITKNVMPVFGQLDIEPARKSIRDVFIRKIIEAKGLSGVQRMTDYEIIPTPLAVLKGCELLSLGTKHTPGMGEFFAVDVGGATTDVYSMAKGEPTFSNALVKGLPEPYSKRTVEGDLGMRYSLGALVDEVGVQAVAAATGVAEDDVCAWVAACTKSPDTVAPENSVERRLDETLARFAVALAAERHCGVVERVYTPVGEMFTLNGKDLSDIPFIIGIGGVLINSKRPASILRGAVFSTKKMNLMLPKAPRFLLDTKYIFSSMGLLSMVAPELALKIMKQAIQSIPEDEHGVEE